MTWQEFAEQLRRDLAYETGGGTPARKAFVALRYYRRLGGIVWHGCRCAQRGAFDDVAWAEHSLATLRAVEAVGGHVRVTGLEHVAQTPGAVVFIGNHMSTLETVLLPGKSLCLPAGAEMLQSAPQVCSE